MGDTCPERFNPRFIDALPIKGSTRDFVDGLEGTEGMLITHGEIIESCVEPLKIVTQEIWSDLRDKDQISFAAINMLFNDALLSQLRRTPAGMVTDYIELLNDSISKLRGRDLRFSGPSGTKERQTILAPAAAFSIETGSFSPLLIATSPEKQDTAYRKHRKPRVIRAINLTAISGISIS